MLDSGGIRFMFSRKIPTFAIAFLIFVLSTISSLGQPAINKQAIKGKLVEVKINAPSLKGNLLSDPTEQNVSVYLPPGYENSNGKRYPVIYLLHAFGLDNQMWSAAAFGLNVPSMMDKLIESGKIREMIIVAPNAKNAYNGSFYTNSTVTGNWEDYIYKDVTSYVDANYRTLARASSRGIAGHSMGGFGAVSVGMKHADIFSAIYAMSPCCLGLVGDLNEPNPVWKRVTNFTSIKDLPKQVKSPDDFYQYIFLALPAAFSPNAASNTFYGDFLYREKDGKMMLNEAAAASWKAKMPLYLIDDYKQNLLSMRGIFLDFGQKEENSHIRLATPLFSQALSERSIPHSFEIYEGGTHISKVKDRLQTRVLEFFSERLDFSQP
jgi:S-formylglutathione hydrolase